MKVVLLTTARGQRPAAVRAVVEELGIADDPSSTVTVVGWHPPRRPLPVDRNLVLGGLRAPDGSARDRATAPWTSDDPAPVDEPGPNDGSADVDVLPPTEAGPRGSDGLPAVVAPVEQPDLDPDDQPGDDGARPVARVVHGVRWRVRRARQQVDAIPQVQRVRNSTKVRRVTSRVSSTATLFMLRALRAPNVNQLVADADLVVALDAHTHRAAWFLARRHPRPAVLVGAAAGARFLSGRDG